MTRRTLTALLAAGAALVAYRTRRDAQPPADARWAPRRPPAGTWDAGTPMERTYPPTAPTITLTGAPWWQSWGSGSTRPPRQPHHAACTPDRCLVEALGEGEACHPPGGCPDCHWGTSHAPGCPRRGHRSDCPLSHDGPCPSPQAHLPTCNDHPDHTGPCNRAGVPLSQAGDRTAPWATEGIPTTSTAQCQAPDGTPCSLPLGHSHRHLPE